MLTFLVKLLQLLNSENSARQMAFALCLGCLWGLSPFLSVQGLLALFFLFILKANIASFMLAGGIFSAVLVVMTEQIAQVGAFLLTHQALQTLFTSLYQFSWFKVAQLNHTTILGALVVAAVIFMPLYFISLVFIEKYRTHVKAFFEKFQLVKALKASRFYRLYVSMSTGG